MNGNFPAGPAKSKVSPPARAASERHGAITDTLSKWRDYQAWALSMKSQWAKKPPE
jgi:hypothetical protein